MTKNDNVMTKSVFYRTNPNLIPNSSIKILNFLLQEFFLGLPPLTDENFNSINSRLICQQHGRADLRADYCVSNTATRVRLLRKQ